MSTMADPLKALVELEVTPPNWMRSQQAPDVVARVVERALAEGADSRWSDEYPAAKVTATRHGIVVEIKVALSEEQAADLAALRERIRSIFEEVCHVHGS